MKTLKVTMFVDVEEGEEDSIYKWTHHIEYAIDMDSYPEISCIYGVEVEEIESEDEK